MLGNTHTYPLKDRTLVPHNTLYHYSAIWITSPHFFTTSDIYIGLKQPLEAFLKGFPICPICLMSRHATPQLSLISLPNQSINLHVWCSMSQFAHKLIGILASYLVLACLL